MLFWFDIFALELHLRTRILGWTLMHFQYNIFTLIRVTYIPGHAYLPGYYHCFDIYGILVLVNTCRRCMEYDLDFKIKSQLWKMCLLVVVVIEGSSVGLGVGGVPRLTSNPIERLNSTWISILTFVWVHTCIGILIAGQVKMVLLKQLAAFWSSFWLAGEQITEQCSAGPLSLTNKDTINGHYFWRPKYEQFALISRVDLMKDNPTLLARL